MGEHVCDVLNIVPIAKDAVTACGECNAHYQAVEMDSAGRLAWVPLAQVAPEDRAVTEEYAAGAIPTKVELFPVLPGTASPLMLDMGQDVAIVIQPKPGTEEENVLALNIIAGGGLTPDVVAWMLGQASEAMVRGIRNAKLQTP